MRLPSLDAGTIAFLRRFFGPGNLISWSKIVQTSPGQELAVYLAPWFDDLANAPRAPIVLPRRQDHDRTTWYALGHAVRDAEALREHLLAFIGSTYSDFDGQRADLDPTDEVEAAVLEFTEGHAFRFHVPSLHRDTVRALLLTMRELWHQTPSLELRLSRPTGRILRELALALATRNTAEATSRLEELRDGGRLDARNLLFLDIRRLAIAERWEEIVALPQLPDLAQLRCPVPVAEAILCAIYAVEFTSFELKGDVDGALAHFRTSVIGRWSSFFRVLSTVQAPSALKLFMMLAAIADPPRPELRDTILASTSLQGADRAYCEHLAQRVVVPVKATEDPFSEAVARFEAGDYDSAFPLFIAAPTSARALSLMLYCAVELQRLDATRAVYQAMSLAPDDIRAAVLASARHRLLWEHLAGAAVPPPIAAPLVAGRAEVSTDWITWIERLTKHGRWSKALEVAEHGAREWSPADLLENAEKVTALQSWIAARSSRDAGAQTTLRDAIPHLVTFLLREPRLLPKARDLFLDLLLVLTDDEEAGASDLSAVRDVVSALLDIGPSPGDYIEYLKFLDLMWTRFEAPRSLDWLLETVEILTIFSCPAPDARERFLSHVLRSFARWRGHVRPDQWQLLEVLCHDLDAEAVYRAIAPPTPKTGESNVGEVSLNNSTVAIYSLMEQSAQHARDALLKEFPGITVVLNADKVATDRLRELAKHADVFVMVTWAAKHAATECIESARPSILPLLRPVSKSATAILREIRCYLGLT
ncbi:protein DpdD [Sorangium sp. So ce134]